MIYVDDAVYFVTLFMCMALGGYYKRIDDLVLKRNYGAGLGLLIATLICGTKVYHSIVMVWGNIIIIKCCSIKYAHQLSLGYTWTYLTYMYLHDNMSIYTIWLHQNIALRVVGLATEAYYDEEFYAMFGSELRYLYNLPQLLMFFLERQMMMMLCTCVFTETGFGVYPAKCAPAPGHGPTLAPSLLKLASTKTEVALKQEFNFAMLKCFHNEKIIFGPRMRDTIAGWEMATRYWFNSYVLEVLIKGNKDVRSACTFAVWWVWNGPTLPHLLMAATLWVYVLLEDEYLQLCCDARESVKCFPWNLGFSLMRLFCLLYLAPCFIVPDTRVVFRYYNSIYWAFHIMLLLLIVAVAVVNNLKNRENTRPR